MKINQNNLEFKENYRYQEHLVTKNIKNISRQNQKL